MPSNTEILVDVYRQFKVILSGSQTVEWCYYVPSFCPHCSEETLDMGPSVRLWAHGPKWYWDFVMVSYGLCSDISVEYSMSQPFTFSRIWVPGCSSTCLLLTSPACEKQQATFRVPPPVLFTITRCGGLWYSFCEVPGACFSYNMPRCNKVVRPGLLGSASTFYLWLTHQATLCHYCSTFKCGWSNIYWAAGQDALSSLL